MYKAKITGKGQVTLPKEVREKLDVSYGDHLVFDTSGKDIILKSFKQARLTDLYRSLPATRPYPGKEEIRREVAEAMIPYGEIK
jgi:AbrB family looped-hinge helix DNA binding protein